MDVLLGILLALMGIVVATSGLRMFFFMLPIIGFVSGFFLGATLVDNLFGQTFLSTITGWVLGFVIGVLFAIISYLWWYVGALLAAGATGALLFSGIFAAFGAGPVIMTSFAIVGAILFFVGALILNLPIYIVLVNTAIIGAYMVIAGLLLMLGRVETGTESGDLGYGAASAAVQDSWFWWLVLIGISIVGIGSQLKLINSIRMPDERWVKAEPVQ